MSRDFKMYEVTLAKTYIVYATDEDDATDTAIQFDSGEGKEYYDTIEVTAHNTEKGEAND